MATLQNVIEYLETQLETITGAPVHTYERTIKTYTELQSLASVVVGSDREIEVWTIAVESDNPDSDTAEGTVDFTFGRTYTLVLRGYYGHDDARATGIAWQYKIEAVLDGLDNKPTLGGNANRSGPPRGRSRDQIRMFGNWMCHYAEIAFPVTQKRDRV